MRGNESKADTRGVGKVTSVKVGRRAAIADKRIVISKCRKEVVA